MAKCWSSSDEKTETERNVRANDPDFNAQFKYANNFIKTSKYSLVTFVPQNLFEQFQRLANFYFLCLLVLQLIPQISSLTFVTTAVPLAVVLTVTALKDAIDDFQRHRSDSQVNNRSSHVLREGRLIEERWFRVQVGDIVRMENDHFVAADLLLLSSSEPNGLCYIETAELDGETNLKCRQALPETAEMGEDHSLFGKFKGDIVCEAPNNNLSRFEGTLRWEGETYPLDNEKVLYRGCVLRNTRWCYGIVLFAGRDTKLMQNSGKSVFKRTTLDRMLNVIIIGIVFFLLSLCLFCTIACGVWETVTGRDFHIYLPRDPSVPETDTGSATVTALLVFFSYGIVMNTVVPISLYVSVEVIRFFHSLMINWDEKMYYAPKDTPAKARTTTLNEELGQIEYIFSDKTGTLTQNIMTFNKCSINGKQYGDLNNEATGEPVVITEETQSVDFSFNPMHEAKFRFFDDTLLEDIRNGDQNVFEFFRLLALCHTVMSEEKPGGVLEYQAQSPDEEALTSAARNFGFVFRNRTPTSVVIEVMGHREVYDLYCILDFNNVRKRMSVILRKDGILKLYCKGADSVIFERLDEKCSELKYKTLDHLNKYASEGLRTLCLAVKELEDDFFEEWKEKFHAAATSMENREEKVNAVYEEIERDLVLLGATAIEDKLQDGVPDAIANLALADIKLWVLTGDKQETAINIGYSCHLLSDEMVEIFVVDAEDYTGVGDQLRRFREAIAHVLAHSTGAGGTCSIIRFENEVNDAETPVDPSGGFALVVNGHSLVFALDPRLETLFVEVACQCKAVICCRVTPLQKALVVDLIKRHKGAVTLAIGDGANDVSMIKTAHIGVGISGQEGMQAVLASDFSFAQFRYLERLLLVHGRWSYFRISKFLRYFFYKNFAFTLGHFWFAFFCGFSAQTLYDPNFISCYNVFYTSMPVLALGIFDQDVDERNSLSYPQLYTPGHKNLLFNGREFAWSLVHGLLTSLTLFFLPYGALKSSIDPDGLSTDGRQLFGTAVATLLVFAVTAQVALDTSYWTFFNHIVILGSIAFFFSLTLTLNSDFLALSYCGALHMTLATPAFWATAILLLTVLLIPVLANRFYRTRVHPTLADRVRLKQRRLRRQQDPDDLPPMPQIMPLILRRPSRRKSLRSGYAFAHQEGFGRLIMSGKIMRKMTKSNSGANNMLPPLLPGAIAVAGYVSRPHANTLRE